MSEHKFFQIDAFAEKAMAGGPAAVMPMEAFPAADVMQAIAAENNLAETAFVVAKGGGAFDLRWFTPALEVPLCGHATLAAGAMILSELESGLEVVVFDTQAGPLVVRETPEGFTLDLPRRVRTPWTPPAASQKVCDDQQVVQGKEDQAGSRPEKQRGACAHPGAHEHCCAHRAGD